MKYYRAFDGMLWLHDPNGWWCCYDHSRKRWMKVTTALTVQRGLKPVTESDLVLEML